MRKKLTNEEFLQRCKEKGISDNIEIRGEYVDYYTKIVCYCKKHNYEWGVRPDKIFTIKGCKFCAQESGRN